MTPQRVVLAGAGTMGRGIARWFVEAGAEVFLQDISSEVLAGAREKMIASWKKRRGEEEAEKLAAGLHLCSLAELPGDCDLLVEAVVEDADIKVRLLQELDFRMDAACVFASNTSSIPIDSMARELGKERRRRFVGLHFFNPAFAIKLVEIVAGHWSDPALCSSLEKWFLEKGKRPIICRDSPGFIANRVVRGFYGEALRIAGRDDVERFKEIDQVMREGAGMPMGPFELMDLIGVSVNHTVTCSLWESFYRDRRFLPHPLQRAVACRGGGFYS